MLVAIHGQGGPSATSFPVTASFVLPFPVPLSTPCYPHFHTSSAKWKQCYQTQLLSGTPGVRHLHLSRKEGFVGSQLPGTPSVAPLTQFTLRPQCPSISTLGDLITTSQRLSFSSSSRCGDNSRPHRATSGGAALPRCAPCAHVKRWAPQGQKPHASPLGSSSVYRCKGPKYGLLEQNRATSPPNEGNPSMKT